MVSVCIVSGIALHREGLAACLSTDGRVRVRGTLIAGENPVAKIRRFDSDVALLDMPPAQARSLAYPLRLTAPEVKLVALAVPEVEDQVVACAEAGISGCVSPGASFDQLIAVIEDVARGELRCSAKAAGSLMRRVGELVSSRSAAGAADVLTRREVEVLDLVGHGLSNQEIAAKLQLELPTVKNHVHHLLAKLGARTRAEAVALARGAPDARASWIDADRKPA